MTQQEFSNLSHADVRFKGKKYYLPKNKYDFSSPLCTRKQYKNGNESFAHVYKSGDILRYGKRVGTIEDLSLIKENNPVNPDLKKAFPRVLKLLAHGLDLIGN